MCKWITSLWQSGSDQRCTSVQIQGWRQSEGCRQPSLDLLVVAWQRIGSFQISTHVVARGSEEGWQGWALAFFF